MEKINKLKTLVATAEKKGGLADRYPLGNPVKLPDLCFKNLQLSPVDRV